MFNSRSITGIALETTLSGNQWIEDEDRYKWFVGGPKRQTYKQYINDLSNTTIVLNPMQIRTFIIKLT